MDNQKFKTYKYVALTKDKEIYFSTQKEGAIKLGVSLNMLSGAIYGRSTSLIKQGIFVYRIEEFEGLKPVREHRIIKSKTKNPHKQKIHMLDAYTNEILTTYESLVDAAKDLEINIASIGNISKCCRGKIRTAFGYKWELAEN